MEAALPLDFKLYLEGVLVDFESVSITSKIGRPSMANISIPPTVLSQKILPRTSVHLFYMDPDESYSSSAPKELIGQPVFKLLFEGEVIAVSYNKTTEGRATTLVCSDLTNNFDYAHRFTIEDTAPLTGSPCEEMVSGTKAAIGLRNNATIGGPISRFITNEETISEGVQRLIKAVFTGDSDLSEKPTNEFLESVESRYQISKRVTALQDEDIKRLSEVKNFEPLGARSIGRSPPTLSLTEIINMFLSFIYYNRISMIAPAYNNNVIESLVLLPNIFFSPPPRCNVLFPDHVGNIGYTDDFLRMPTRLFLQTSPVGTPGRGSRFTQCASTYLAPRELSAALPTGGSGLAKQENQLQRTLTSEEKLKGIVPVFKVVGQPEYVTSLGARSETKDEISGKDRDSVRNYMLNMAEYELELRRANTRSVNSMSGPFNPETVIGAPIVVLDEVLFIFGILHEVTHTIHAASGATTTYAIGLSRRVSTKFDELDLTDDTKSAIFETIDKIITADRLKDDDARKADNLESLTDPLNSLVEADGDERLIDVVRKFIGSALNERDSVLEQYDLLVNYGIYEELPETPRWINSKFSGSNASNSYTTLYGTSSILKPISSSSEQDYNSMSYAANKLMTSYNLSLDKYHFTKTYTKRSNITTQNDFNTFYGLPHLSDRSQSYPSGGPFTERRRKPVLRYSNDLKLNRAHSG